MFQPFTFARPQQQLSPAGYPGYGYYAPAGLTQVANMGTPWISPGGQVVSPSAATVVFTPAVSLLLLLSAGFSAYHGYKRNHDNVGWAFGWGLGGVLFPIITPVIALAEGYAKPEHK